MAWVLLVVALALVTGYLIITYGYRTSVIVLLVTLVLGLAIIIWYAEFHQDTRSNLISTDEVRLENFRVEAVYGNSYKMYARVLNNSTEFPLMAAGIQLNAADCPSPEGDEGCIIVGQQQQEIQVNVPPRQARDVTYQFIFPPMRPQGVLKWTHEVQYVKAQK
jgi:hypothetical protein